MNILQTMADGSRDNFTVGEDVTSSLESKNLWDGDIGSAAAESFNTMRYSKTGATRVSQTAVYDLRQKLLTMCTGNQLASMYVPLHTTLWDFGFPC